MIAGGLTLSDINRRCKECGDFVKDTHEGVPFVDGTAMCMDCFTEDYIHYGKKILDAIERGGLFDEEVETSDEQWFDDPEWIEMNRGDPFEQAWDSIVKIDEGMWEEIYAPLLNQTTGMGKLPFAEYASDFVPTKFAIDNVIATRPKYGDNWNYMNQSKRRGGDGLNTDENFMDYLMRNKGDHGFDVDTLVQSILEEGFQPMKGADRSGRLDPTFEFNDFGIKQFEGRHRLLALDKLGAPYVPYMGFMSGMVDPEMIEIGSAYEHPFELGQDFRHTMQNNKLDSLGRYMKRGRIPVPPSYLYGREMVSGMGRLVPTNRLGEPIDLLTDMSQTDSNMDSLEAFHARNKREPVNPFDPKSVSRNQQLLQQENFRNKAKWKWNKKPSWKVVFDD